MESVLGQTYQDYELIVVCDCDGEPTKEIEAVVDSFSAKFEELGIEGRFLATEERFGSQAGPKNWATYHANGTYIAYLDGDNAWYPRHLEALLESIREGEVWPDFTYCRRRYVRDEGAPLKVGDTELSEGDSPYVPWNDASKQRIGSHPLNNFIDTSDFLIAKGSIYNKIHNTGWAWNERHRRFGDWIFIVEGVFFSGWRGKAVDEILSEYHWTGSNISITRPAHEGVGMDSSA